MSFCMLDRYLLYVHLWSTWLLCFICGEFCEEIAEQSLVQCYTGINVNHEAILSLNGSIVVDKFVITGRNEDEFDHFCSNRHKMFSCMGPLLGACPVFLQRYYAIGIDLQGLEVISEYLCSDRHNYLSVLTCSYTPSRDMVQCNQATETHIREVVQGHTQTGSPVPSKYMESVCKITLTHMNCTLAAYGKICDADSVAMRTKAECGMLSKPCRESPQFQSEYTAICQKVTTPTPVQIVRFYHGHLDTMSRGSPYPSTSGAEPLRLSAAMLVVTSGVLLLAFT